NAIYRTRTSGWTFSTYYKFTGRTPYYEIITGNGAETAHLATISAYNWADASVQKNLPKGFSITGGVRNVFNVTNIGTTSVAAGSTHSSGPSRPIGSGRSYFLSLTYSLNQ